MLTNETTSKLHEMHLGAMAEAFTVQMNDSQYNGLSFEDRFSMLVDAEWTRRKSNRLHSLIRAAGYAAPSACVEDISYAAQRQLDKAQLLRLAACTYIEQAHNVVILGATGTGKTYLACALGIAANRNYYSTKYIRLPDLLVEIAMARGDGTYREIGRAHVELQSPDHLVCRLLLEKKKKKPVQNEKRATPNHIVMKPDKHSNA